MAPAGRSPKPDSSPTPGRSAAVLPGITRPNFSGPHEGGQPCRDTGEESLTTSSAKVSSWSRIVAETLVTLIKYSPYSIIEDKDWRPAYGRPATGTEPARFEMIDLLKHACVVDPIASFIRRTLIT
jgi:hypothetical protein